MEAEFKVPLDVVTGVNKPTQRVLRLKLIAASLFLTLCFVIIVVFLSRQQQVRTRLDQTWAFGCPSLAPTRLIRENHSNVNKFTSYMDSNCNFGL